MNVVQSTENLISRVKRTAPFGKFERFTAGFCMAIPFYLLVTDEAYANRDLWMLFVPILITLLPLTIPRLVSAIEDHKNYGMAITIGGGIVLFLLYLLFTDVFGLQSRESISAYVTMENSYIFGMLLAIAAMLFIASGVVYWNKKESFREGAWRSILNVALGVLLLGVIIFPVDKMYEAHMFFALTFFLGCGVASIRREAKPPKRIQHRIFDFIPVAVMGFAMVVAFCHDLDLIGESWFSYINLFGAESIALWITGIDFILVSLKREMDPGGNDPVTADSTLSADYLA